jgi:hypothetical protein
MHVTWDDKPPRKADGITDHVGSGALVGSAAVVRRAKAVAELVRHAPH